MEAMSVEDEGEGISFHIYVYNVQPGVEINYATGESSLATANENEVSTEKSHIFSIPTTKNFTRQTAPA